jgi:hypothetical protein
MNQYPKRILLLFHGNNHLLRKDSILGKLEIPFTIEIIQRIKTIDINPECNPTIVADLEKPLPQEQVDALGEFDLITSEYPPFVVYENDVFFSNIVALLAPGGSFAFWPGILTESKYPMNPYLWIIPLCPYKDMKARTKMANDIMLKHRELTSLTKKNKLLILRKDDSI